MLEDTFYPGILLTIAKYSIHQDFFFYFDIDDRGIKTTEPSATKILFSYLIFKHILHTTFDPKCKICRMSIGCQNPLVQLTYICISKQHRQPVWLCKAKQLVRTWHPPCSYCMGFFLHQTSCVLLSAHRLTASSPLVNSWSASSC